MFRSDIRQVEKVAHGGLLLGSAVRAADLEQRHNNSAMSAWQVLFREKSLAIARRGTE
jgi:hypothetical protein